MKRIASKMSVCATLLLATAACVSPEEHRRLQSANAALQTQIAQWGDQQRNLTKENERLRADVDRLGKQAADADWIREQKQKLDELMSAERKKRSEDELDRTASTYKKILGLTDEQTVSFRIVLAEGRKQRREGYKPGGDWRQARKESRDKQNKEVEKVLSPEQYKRYVDVSELERFDR